MPMPKLVLAAAFTVAFAGSAAAGAGQCYWPGGQPVGPLYNTDSPNYGWIQWVQQQGGVCRGVSMLEEQGLRSRAQGYPPEFASGNPNYRPPGYQPPGYQPGYQPPGYQPGYQPPANAWYGDPNRASYLIGQWLAYQGRPYARVRDTGRLVYVHGRSWRVFFVRWQGGGRMQAAVRLMRRSQQYMAMQSYDGANWSQAQPIGQ